MFLKIIFPENLVEHDFDVMAGVPVAVVIKAAGLFEDAGQLHAARAHVVNVSLGVLVPVFKGALLLGFAPKDFVVAVRVERRVDVNEIDALRGQFFQLLQIVAAIDDAGVHLRRGFLSGSGGLFHPAISDTKRAQGARRNRSTGAADTADGLRG